MNFLVNPVYADVDIGSKFGPAQGGLRDVSTLINVIARNVLMIAGIIAFIAVIVAGIRVITSAGDVKAQEENKGALTAAVIGLLLIFGAYFILQIVSAILGFNLLNPPL